MCVDETIQHPAVERRLQSSAVVCWPSWTLGGVAASLRSRERNVRRPLLDPCPPPAPWTPAVSTGGGASVSDLHCKIVFMALYAPATADSGDAGDDDG